MELNRIVSLPIRNSHLAALEGLSPIHRDPFDRMIVAQARSEKIPILSGYSAIRKYGVQII